MNAMRKYAVWIVGIGLGAFILLSVVSGLDNFGSSKSDSSVRPVSKPYEPIFRHDGNTFAISGSDTIAVFRTEYAKTQEAIEIGMMYRRNVDSDMAMLFFMSGGDQMRSFWMKNTYVPLDIIYINSDHRVVSIQKNAVPKSTASLPSERPASFVLEVLGGVSDQLGIETGTEIYWYKE